jgi:hypothetical protein
MGLICGAGMSRWRALSSVPPRSHSQRLAPPEPASLRWPCRSIHAMPIIHLQHLAQCSSLLCLCLTTVRFRSILRHLHRSYLHPTARVIAISPAHPSGTSLTPTHPHPRPPSSPHFTSFTPGDRACVVAVRSFPLLVVLLRRRIHTSVRCLCSALCDFEPPRYPGTLPPSAPALRPLAADADTISLPPPGNTLPSAYCMI